MKQASFVDLKRTFLMIPSEKGFLSFKSSPLLIDA